MNTMKFARKFALPLFVALAYAPAQGMAASILGATLDNYAVLAHQGETSTPLTSNIIGGNMGSDLVPATPLGFSFSAGAMIDNANALAAQGQLTTAVGIVNTAAAGGTDLAPFVGNLDNFQTFLGGSIAPGNYNYAGVALLNGTLILAGGSNPNPVWNFKFNQLTTGSISNVSVTGSFLANAGIYWSVGQATLDGVGFAGNVMSASAITSTTDIGMTIGCGRLLAQTASVTLSNDTISTRCVGIGAGSNGFDQANVAAIPEPETYAMLLSGLGLMGFVARRRQRNLAAAA